jgi:hypothetical protein
MAASVDMAITCLRNCEIRVLKLVAFYVSAFLVCRALLCMMFIIIDEWVSRTRTTK